MLKKISDKVKITFPAGFVLFSLFRLGSQYSKLVFLPVLHVVSTVFKVKLRSFFKWSENGLLSKCHGHLDLFLVGVLFTSSPVFLSKANGDG